MSYRTARFDHQAGSLLPETRACTFSACPTYGHPFGGTSTPTSQVSTIKDKPQIAAIPVTMLSSMPRSYAFVAWPTVTALHSWPAH